VTPDLRDGYNGPFVESFVEQIHRIYDCNPNRFYPYVGAAFTHPNDADLRVMGVGINAHSQEKDLASLRPEHYAQWFEQKKWRYQKGVWRDVGALGAKVTDKEFLFAGRVFPGAGSIFLTNAVKVYVVDSDGKRADQLRVGRFEEHLDQWHDELDAMAEAGALPHVIAIIGKPFWQLACASFIEAARSQRFRHLSISRHSGADDGRGAHFVDRFVLESKVGRQDLLLVRLRHPAARTHLCSPRWLFEQDAFREIAGSAS
jgi:hypothetical protein